jgi:signal transduction histidine kinase
LCARFLLVCLSTGPGRAIWLGQLVCTVLTLGLGLAIVKGIIEAHHGGIAEVGTEGQGARFVIILPLKKDIMQ